MFLCVRDCEKKVTLNNNLIDFILLNYTTTKKRLIIPLFEQSLRDNRKYLFDYEKSLTTQSINR